STLRVRAGLGRLGALAAVAARPVVYLGPRTATPPALLLTVPIVACAAAVAWRELRAWPPSDAAVAAVGRMVALGLGMAVPLAAYALLYLRRGALGALVTDTLSGLPQRIAWFVPIGT